MQDLQGYDWMGEPLEIVEIFCYLDDARGGV